MSNSRETFGLLPGSLGVIMVAAPLPAGRLAVSAIARGFSPSAAPPSPA
jgi:hypothetical protein